jgi:hypothetical protein
MRHPFHGSARLAAALLCLAGPRCLALPAIPLCVDPDQAATLFQHVAEADLKALYVRCARESSERRLSMEEAAHCSKAADVLKVRAFGGDFETMIGWLRLQGEDRYATQRDGSNDRRPPR